MLDISQALGQKEYDYEIVHPADEEVKFFCKVTGMKEDLKVYRQYEGKTTVKNGVSFKEDPNYYEIGRVKFVKTIVNWEGITEKGKPWPCTTENKSLLWDRYHKTLGDFIIKELEARVAAEVQLESGN